MEKSNLVDEAPEEIGKKIRWGWEMKVERDEAVLLKITEALSTYIRSCSSFSLKTEKTWLMLPQVGVTGSTWKLPNTGGNRSNDFL